MKVKIGNKIYSSADEPIMLVLGPGDKDAIESLAPDANMICCFPKDYDRAAIAEFVKPHKGDVLSDLPNHWINQEDFTVGDWCAEVANNDTRLGYLDWVASQREQASHEPQ